MKACAGLGDAALQQGKSIVRTCGAQLKSDTRLQGAVVQMYVKCGDPKSALLLWPDVSNTNDPELLVSLHVFLLDVVYCCS